MHKSAPSTMQVRALTQWTAGLDYRLIRSVEALQPSEYKGKRLRGVLIGDTLCIGRDAQFYDVSTVVAQHLAPTEVLERYTVEQVQEMFKLACHAVRRTRQRARGVANLR